MYGTMVSTRVQEAADEIVGEIALMGRLGSPIVSTEFVEIIKNVHSPLHGNFTAKEIKLAYNYLSKLGRVKVFYQVT
jgi:hypothetical protein